MRSRPSTSPGARSGSAISAASMRRASATCRRPCTPLHYTNLAHGLGVEAIRSRSAETAGRHRLNADVDHPGSDSTADLGRRRTRHRLPQRRLLRSRSSRANIRRNSLEALGDRMPVDRGRRPDDDQPEDSTGGASTTTRRCASPTIRTEGRFPGDGQAPAGQRREDRYRLGSLFRRASTPSIVRISMRATSCRTATSPRTAPATIWASINGAVDDQPRLDYIADHLSVTADLIKEGYPDDAAISPGA